MIPLENGNSCVGLSIPSSLAKPHVVSHGNHWRFYGRNSRGKYQLDLDEVREAVLLSNKLAEQMQNFRINRLARITSGETPIPIENGKPTLVLHVCPLEAFSSNHMVDIASLRDSAHELSVPIDGCMWSKSYNFDGYITYEKQGQTGSSYTQFFRNGCVEALATDVIREPPMHTNLPTLENKILKSLEQYLQATGLAGSSFPYAVMVSILNAKGVAMEDERGTSCDRLHPVERDQLICPEVYLENSDTNLGNVMFLAFAPIWNSMGWFHPYTYDFEGNRLQG